MYELHYINQHLQCIYWDTLINNSQRYPSQRNIYIFFLFLRIIWVSVNAALKLWCFQISGPRPTFSVGLGSFPKNSGEIWIQYGPKDSKLTKAHYSLLQVSKLPSPCSRSFWAQLRNYWCCFDSLWVLSW